MNFLKVQTSKNDLDAEGAAEMGYMAPQAPFVRLPDAASAKNSLEIAINTIYALKMH